MAAILEAHVLNELRSLKGRARVTYPYGDADYPVVQRLVQVPRGTNPDGWKIAFSATDEQFTSCQLVDQQKLSEDNINVEVLRTYERVPGIVIDGAVSSLPEGATTLQVVAHGTEPERGVNVLESTVQTETKAKASRRTVTARKREITPAVFGSNAIIGRSGLVPLTGFPEMYWSYVPNGSVAEPNSDPAPEAGGRSIYDFYTRVENLSSMGVDHADVVVEFKYVTSAWRWVLEVWTYDDLGVEIETGSASGSASAGTEAVPWEAHWPDGSPKIVATQEVLAPESDDYIIGHPQMQTKSKGVPNLIPEKYRGQIATVQTTTQHELDGADINDIPEPDAPTGDQSQIVHEKVNDERYQKVVVDEVIDENADPLEGAQTGTWGQESTDERIVVDGTPADNTEPVRESRVVPLGNGKSIKSTILYPTPQSSPESGVIGMLRDQDTDNQTGVITEIEKLLVIESQAPSVMTARRTAGWFVEKQQQNDRHSILICSRLPDDIPDQIYWDHENISLPDQLLSVGVNWSKTRAGTGDTYLYFPEGSTQSNGGSATLKASVALSGAVALRVQAGFSGKALAKITRKFRKLANIGSVATPAYNIRPSVGTVTIENRSRSTGAGRVRRRTVQGGTANHSITTGSQTVKIGPFLTWGGSLSFGHVDTEHSWFSQSNQWVAGEVNVTETARAYLSMPSSWPSSISSGQLVARFQRTVTWRMGWHVIEIVEVYAP